MARSGSNAKQGQLPRWLRWLLPVQLLIITASGGFTVGAVGTLTVLLARGNFGAQIGTLPSQPVPGTHVVLPLPTTISPIFAASVQYWQPEIVAWGQQYGIDPNLIATVMQIESCGDASAQSSAGAQGLFQVMPFHFQAGDNPLDPETNAGAGLSYLRGALIKADGNVGLALAGYNGGYGVMDVGWGRWPAQTQDYYKWGTTIYLDALNGKTSSPALQDWLSAGGDSLCSQALNHLNSTATPTVS